MNAIQFPPVSAARTVVRRIAQSRQVAFWMREVDPAWSIDTLRARVVDIIAETHDVRTFVLAPNRLWPGHLAGQFVTVELEVDGVRAQRCYSISSAPGDAALAITVKRVAGGRVSTWMHDHMRRGDVVTLGTPSGEFLAPEATSKLLLVSGGSGATPVMSILRDLSRRDAVRDVVFVHAARSKRDVIFERELEALSRRHSGLRVELFLETDGGRLDVPRLRDTVADFANREAMLCGPAPMMSALAPMWSDAGVEHRLKTERFVPPAKITTAPRAVGEKVKLTLLRSGRTVVGATAGTLLEELESAGERPANGCRMGICNTCVCRKRSGVVEDVVTGKISSEPDEDIRICVSRARTDVALAL
jgi:ferredoxin-NADP reductase